MPLATSCQRHRFVSIKYLFLEAGVVKWTYQGGKPGGETFLSVENPAGNGFTGREASKVNKNSRQRKEKRDYEKTGTTAKREEAAMAATRRRRPRATPRKSP